MPESPKKKSPKTGKRKPAAGKPLPEFIATGALAACTGLTERRIQQLAEEGIIAKPETRGAYPTQQTFRALFDYYREAAAGLPAQTAADRARRERAEADAAQLKTAQLQGILVFKSEAEREMSDVFVRVRDVITRSPLKLAMKKALTEEISKIRLRGDEAES